MPAADRLWLKENRSHGPNGGNTALSNIKTMLLWGEEMELYKLAFRKFPRISHTPPETKRISEDDLGKLLRSAPGDFRDMLLFTVLTGLRPKELMELQRCHFLADGKGDLYVCIERHKTSTTARSPKPRTVRRGSGSPIGRSLFGGRRQRQGP